MEKVGPWHLSIVRTKVGMMGTCSIETMKLLVWKFDEYISFQYWVDVNNVRHKFKI